MSNFQIDNLKLVNMLKEGRVGVLPTDTLYGLVGRAFSKKAIEKIYAIKHRNKKRPLIVLISSVKDLAKFKIKVDKSSEEFFKKNWPGRVSVILPCRNKKFTYLHRGVNSLAFRLPKNKKLISLIKKTGPLVAPSANPEGKKPAENISKAKKYFSSSVDFYVAGKNLKNAPSALVKIEKNKIRILREGSVKIKTPL